MKAETHRFQPANDVAPRRRTGRDVRAMIILGLAVAAVGIVALMLTTRAFETRTERLAGRIETPQLTRVLPEVPPTPGPVVAAPSPTTASR